MGNQNSQTLGSHEGVETQDGPDYTLFIICADILDQLQSDSPEEIARKIKELEILNDEYSMKNLSAHIYNRALTNESTSLKHVELAKFLSDIVIEVPGSSSGISFKDVFLKVAMERFDDFDVGMESFFGNLFNTDMVSAQLTCYWITSLNDRFSMQEKLLKIIRDKIIKNKGSQNCHIESIRRIMQENGITDSLIS